MPRRIRIAYPGAHYHVTDRGNRQSDVFLCDRDRRLFLKRLGEVCFQHSWKCLAYCLMTNHYHLVLRTDRPGLSAGMRELNARYAEHFNIAYGTTGHVFQGRFRDDLILSDAYLLEAIRYVELNPVRAGLCTSPADWRWNSYGAMVGDRSHTAWFDRDAALAMFSTDPLVSREQFIEFVHAVASWKPHTPTAVQQRRLDRDRAIRQLHASGNHSVRQLARTFGVSVGTIARILKCSTLGSDPNVEH